MTTESTPSERLNQMDRNRVNKWLVDYLTTTMEEGSGEVAQLRGKLRRTYTIVVVLSVIMFCMGMVLLSAPVIQAIKNAISNSGEAFSWESFASGGFGITDLAALFFYRPIERIHKLMGDMSQLTLALNSYQSQVALRLLEADARVPSSMGVAAEHINEAAKDSIKTVQDYFEEATRRLRTRA